MKRLNLVVVASLATIALLWSTYEIYAKAPPQPQQKTAESLPDGEPNTSPPPTFDTPDSDPKEEISDFLFQLYNRFVSQGFINQRPLSNSEELWKRDLSLLITAITEYDGSEGGYLTSQFLYHPQEKAQVQYDEENHMYLNFSNPSQTIPIGERAGITSCTLTDVDQDTADLAIVISHNLQCLYSQFLRNAYRNRSDSNLNFDYDFILSSGVNQHLDSYLSTLKMNGLVTDYLIKLEDDAVVFDVFPEAIGLKTMTIFVSPVLVNIFMPDEEANNLENTLNELISEFFVYAKRQSSHPITSVYRELLMLALGRANELGATATPNQKKTAFMEAYGLTDIDKILQDTSSQRPTPCTYSDPIATPCNNLVVSWEGPDHNGANPFDAMRSAITSALSQYNYKFFGVASPYTNIQKSFQILKNAEVFIFNGHGSKGGIMPFMCFPSIKFGTTECCNKLKEVNQELTGWSIECDPKLDAWGYPSIRSYSTGESACDKGGTDKHSCQISVGQRIYEFLGTKAAIFSNQCYGGACNSSYSYIDNNVMDYWGAHPNKVNFTSSTNGDAAILKEDILGQSQEYLSCIESLPNQPTAPFCLRPMQDDVVGENLHSVQSSFESRGSCNASSEVMYYDGFTADGWQKYFTAQVHGNSNVSIEFAPKTQRVILDSGGLNLFIQPSSKIQAGVGIVKIDDASCHPRLASLADKSGWTIEDTGVDVNLSGWPIMPEWFWRDKHPEELQRDYGADQNGWRWFLKVKASGLKAPNGVDFDGNASASQKWIWPAPGSDVAPWSNLSGVAPNGDPFEVWVPCVPPIQCCYPFLDLDDYGKVVVNGCECGETSSMRTDPGPEDKPPLNGCYTLNPRHDPNHPNDPYTGERFYKGTYHLDASCCDDEVCPYKIVTSELCQPDPPCPPEMDPPPSRQISKSQYRNWPMDQNGDKQCPPITSHCGSCTGE